MKCILTIIMRKYSYILLTLITLTFSYNLLIWHISRVLLNCDPRYVFYTAVAYLLLSINCFENSFVFANYPEKITQVNPFTLWTVIAQRQKLRQTTNAFCIRNNEREIGTKTVFKSGISLRLVTLSLHLAVSSRWSASLNLPFFIGDEKPSEKFQYSFIWNMKHLSLLSRYRDS